MFGLTLRNQTSSMGNVQCGAENSEVWLQSTGRTCQLWDVLVQPSGFYTPCSWCAVCIKVRRQFVQLFMFLFISGCRGLRRTKWRLNERGNQIMFPTTLVCCSSTFRIMTVFLFSFSLVVLGSSISCQQLHSQYYETHYSVSQEQLTKCLWQKAWCTWLSTVNICWQMEVQKPP